jgi:acetoacetyl-CoA reductase
MKDKIALVTGGIRGIGHAISTKLLQEGAYVIAIATNEERNQKWLQEQKQAGLQNVDAFACDVSNFDECAKMVNTIKDKYKRIDILVNNAGITRDGMFKKMTKEQWDMVMRINVDSLFNVTQPVIGTMLENGYGRIINMSSVNAQRGQFGQANYSAAKAAIHGFTKALALETAKKNITVNTVSPGYVNTDMMKNISEEVLAKIVSGVPLGRLAEADEIARMVLFLAAEEAGYITGADFSINGGLHMY